MRPRTIVLGVLVPSFACWWAGFLIFDAGRQALPASTVEAWLGTVALLATALGARALVRASKGDRLWRTGALAGFVAGWFAVTAGGGFVVMLARLREGLVPYLVLPLAAASLTSLALGLWAIGDDLPKRWEWALGSLLVSEFLLLGSVFL